MECVTVACASASEYPLLWTTQPAFLNCVSLYWACINARIGSATSGLVCLGLVAAHKYMRWQWYGIRLGGAASQDAIADGLFHFSVCPHFSKLIL
jgi:hypothetical protein